MPVGTLAKIMCGETRRPREATLRALEQVLFSDSRKISGRADMLRENAVGQPLYEDAGGGAEYDEVRPDMSAVCVSGGGATFDTMVMDRSGNGFMNGVADKAENYEWTGFDLGLRMFTEDFFENGRGRLPLQERERL